MKRIWNIINNLNLGKKAKGYIYIFIMTIMYALLGGVIWLLVGQLFFSSTAWLICFMGYPAVFIGFLGGLIYLYNHEFL